jgi:argininosuccinate lyase
MREGDGSMPPGYLGSDARISSGPARQLVETGYALELGDAGLLHRGLGLADLAHVIALAEQELIPREAAAALLRVVLELLDVPAEDFPYDVRYGDAYNSREKELVRRLGDVAGWVHLGRTRREAGRIAFRMAVRERLLALAGAIEEFVTALADRADETVDLVWADTTYLQPAQPSTFGHYLASFAEEAARHLVRVRAAYAWADTSPAGSGGVAGTRLRLDRRRLADLLGFVAVGANIRDTMWNVDGLTECVLVAVQAVLTADRLAEDLQIFTTPGWGLVQLDASLCRASVLMPQKRNPYALSVIRAGASTLTGRLTGVLVTGRTPSAATDNWLHSYGEVTSSLELATRLVGLAAEVVRTLHLRPDRLAATATGPEAASTDLADELTRRTGWDYRTAYRVVGRAVAEALQRAAGGPASLTAAHLDAAARAITGEPLPDAVRRAGAAGSDDDWLAQVMDPAALVATRTEPGGCGSEQLSRELELLRHRVAEASGWRRGRAAAAADAETRLIEAAQTLSS